MGYLKRYQSSTPIEVRSVVVVINETFHTVKIMADKDIAAVKFELREKVKISVVLVYLPPQQRGVEILNINKDKSVVIIVNLNANSS